MIRSRHAEFKKQVGFTLIEVMLVVVILGVLATLVIPNMVGQDEQARKAAAASDIRAIATALGNYRLDNFSYPSTDQGLAALVEQPSGFPEAKNWRQKYLRKVPTDPWGNEYIYISPGAEGDFDLISFGRDGKAGGEGNDADINFNEL
ncbi:type II secretion system major pseudopilin GspG [Pseudoteredinibacter isoporae]|uniref:type II secretion system major pseudopilin GspG n=1 Tax=Pseudoteredinibacter isoporae TaxID=570281 RepID=UPI00310C7704